jgi:hypothetical protein
MSDTFLEVAGRWTPQRKQTRPTRTAEEKALAAALRERDRLFEIWCSWRDQQVAAALAGPDGARTTALIEFLTRSPLDDQALVAFVRAGQWRGVDPDHRYLAMRLIDDAMLAERERAGLPVFDDPLEGKSPYLEIRGVLR